MSHDFVAINLRRFIVHKNSPEFRKAAEAIVDTATFGLGTEPNVSLHPSLREFLIDEIIENPSMTSELFKNNFLEDFFSEVIEMSQELKPDESNSKDFLRIVSNDPGSGASSRLRF